MSKMKIGVVGCGSISSIYLKNMTQMFHNTDVEAVCDRDRVKAVEQARTYQIPRVCTLEEILKDENIELILNLTTPESHYPIARQALLAGKHVYLEKPLALELDQGKELLEIAKGRGLQIGCAPDTFLGAGIQSSLALIREGEIGRPVSATAFLMGHGHESWHPAPAFYYKKGGGPMFDMGPYYLTALVQLISPVKVVTAMTAAAFSARTVTSKNLFGEIIPVEVPTHISGILEFYNGAVGTIITSFDVWGTHAPCLEIHGTEGSLSVPDPNGFGGQIFLKKREELKWREMPLTAGRSENARGIGVSEMICAIGKNQRCECSGDMAFHVLELMHGFHLAAIHGSHYPIQSTF